MNANTIIQMITYLESTQRKSYKKGYITAKFKSIKIDGKEVVVKMKVIYTYSNTTLKETETKRFMLDEFHSDFYYLFWNGWDSPNEIIYRLYFNGN